MLLQLHNESAILIIFTAEATLKSNSRNTSRFRWNKKIKIEKLLNYEIRSIRCWIHKNSGEQRSHTRSTWRDSTRRCCRRRGLQRWAQARTPQRRIQACPMRGGWNVRNWGRRRLRGGRSHLIGSRAWRSQDLRTSWKRDRQRRPWCPTPGKALRGQRPQGPIARHSWCTPSKQN